MTILFLDVNAATRGERAAALAQQTGWKVHDDHTFKLAECMAEAA